MGLRHPRAGRSTPKGRGRSSRDLGVALRRHHLAWYRGRTERSIALPGLTRNRSDQDPHGLKRRSTRAPREVDALEGDHPMPGLRGCTVAIGRSQLRQSTPGAGRAGSGRGQGSGKGHVRQLWARAALRCRAYRHQGFVGGREGVLVLGLPRTNPRHCFRENLFSAMV